MTRIFFTMSEIPFLSGCLAAGRRDERMKVRALCASAPRRDNTREELRRQRAERSPLPLVNLRPLEFGLRQCQAVVRNRLGRFVIAWIRPHLNLLPEGEERVAHAGGEGITIEIKFSYLL